jgi:hypothetical protein
MEAATMEIVQGVALEPMSHSDLPDTESLLGQLGSMYPVVSYPAAEESAEGEDVDPVEEERRDELDATIMSGLLCP